MKWISDYFIEIHIFGIFIIQHGPQKHKKNHTYKPNAWNSLRSIEMLYLCNGKIKLNNESKQTGRAWVKWICEKLNENKAKWKHK